MPLPSRRYDAVVVGAGPNGLAAALALASAGRAVLVREAAPEVGGGVRSGERTLPGFIHDFCSAIYPMGIGSPFLSQLPLEAHGLRWIHPPVPLAHPLIGEPAVLMRRDLHEAAAELGEDGGPWRRLLGPFVPRWFELAADSLGPLGLPKSPLLMARFGLRAAWPTTWLARVALRTRRGRALLAGLAAHSLLPLEAPVSAAIGLMLGVAGHAVGWPLPEGGAGALSRAMASLLRQLGGEIQTGAPVTSLAELPPDVPVLFDTGPRALAEICGSALPEGYRRRLGRFRYAPGAFKVDYALSGPIPWSDPTVALAGTVHLGGDLDEIAASEAAAWRGEHAPRPFVLLAQQSLFDPSRAPKGQHTGWAYCHVPNGSTRDRLDAIEDQIERFAPGFRDRVLARHISTPADLERYNPNYVGGDVNGGAPTLPQLFTRPVARRVPYSTPNPRIFLCSASTPPGGGVHGMAGWHAAQAALRR